MYAEIVLPQKVGADKETLTYALPASFNVQIGQIVEVPLRNKKVRGVVLKIFEEKPKFETKEVINIVEHAPHLENWQIQLMYWIAIYYFCPLFKAVKLFLPIPFIKKKKIQPWMPGSVDFFSEQKRHVLNAEQKNVLEKLENSRKTVAILQGVTGSGKTEIYLHMADKHIHEGKQVLMLIPEISLSPQTVERFQQHFDHKVAVIHSQLTPKEKEQAWMSIHKSEAKVIIGSRSALFAPFKNLGIIIMDEEHDSSYKQDQSPRYNTLDVAIHIAKLLKIKILAGSATPSLESYYKAKTGEYELVELKERANAINGSMLPVTHIVDLREEIKKKNFSIFSELLQKKIEKKLTSMEQIILFLNRRGAASSVICRECGYVSTCQNCDVPMTYHNRYTVEDSVYHTERLICHHCGRIEKVPHLCPTCQSAYIRYVGLGTQRVESELIKFFPKTKALRADRDTTKKKNSFKLIYNAFKKHEADVLIGTQMIAIGLHLPKVNLVGIILADLGLTIPNFRSSEKTFQLLTQVAGRAGREGKNGEVVIQTYLPHHSAIRRAAMHDYHGFYEEEISYRKSLHYPPFSKLIKLTLSDSSNKKCSDKTENIFKELEKLNEDRNHHITYYPSLIPKFKNKYRWHILISGPAPETLLRRFPSLTDVIIDVDPVSTV